MSTDTESPHAKHSREGLHKKAMLGWFAVDKEGLAKILRRKGMAFIVNELTQNCLDTGAKFIDIRLEPVEGQPKVWITVTDDDPDGFKNLEHAYTLFAESDKKGDPTKRGRFNLGEKLVLACCEEAEIISTRGKVFFDHQGRGMSNQKSACSDKGTTFRGLVRMTRAELEEMRQAVQLIIPPEGREIRLDGDLLQNRTPLTTIDVTLPTEIADDEGFLRRSARRTTIHVYGRQGSVSRLFEMGIPVVEFDLPWDVEIMQKVPLNADRDNVTPAYGREVAVAVVNEMHKYLKPTEATMPGVQEALGDPRITTEAVNTILTHQHGEKRAVINPREPESNAKAFHSGFTVIHGSAYSQDQWESIRRAGAAPPTTTFFPIRLEDAGPELPETKWTAGMQNIRAYAMELGRKVLQRSIAVHFTNNPTASYGACYGDRELIFNVGRLGYKWFDQGANETVDELIIHELSHEFGKHLTKEFDDALARIGARMKRLALDEPEFYRKYMVG